VPYLKDFHYYTQQEVDDLLAAQDEFVELTDTPASYAGEGGKVVNVNSGETALEFSMITEGIFAIAAVLGTL